MKTPRNHVILAMIKCAKKNGFHQINKKDPKHVRREGKKTLKNVNLKDY